jgi:proline racemase
MRAERTLTCWDYHHGQATRILVSGFPSIPGKTMAEKQAHFESSWATIRESLLQEPRGHRNLLGAIVTDPVTEGSALGVLFTHPRGYFEMCGDSAFSLAAFLVDSGVVAAVPGEQTVRVDTVAGPIDLNLVVADGECMNSTIRNVPSYSLGTGTLRLQERELTALLAYGGLTYAMIDRSELGLDSLYFPNLDDTARQQVVDAGSAAWAAARHDCTTGSGQPVEVDLVTLFEPLEGDRGVRVANFYAHGTMGRTPSGTGLSARIAWEHAQGTLAPGEEYIHESILGLRFSGRIDSILEEEPAASPGHAVVAAIKARSFLMGVNQVMLKADDPFRDGFEL